MSTLAYIVLGGIAMSVIALVGSVTLILREETLSKILLPLVSFAAGSLVKALSENRGPPRRARGRV